MKNLVHIQGMGITGCLLALALDELDVEFTWLDNDAPHTAWKASTGAIYPAGKKGSVDWITYKMWEAMLQRPWLKPVVKHFEMCPYWFNHKSPPHNGAYPITSQYRGLQKASAPSYHLNAQKFVPAVRRRFADREIKQFDRTAQRGAMVVRAHGFTERQTHAYWGWTRLVKLKYNKPFTLGTQGDRPCFYFRDGRFIMAYAYPVPGTEWWYSGSSLIKQRADNMHDLGVVGKYERWQKQFERLSNGNVKVIEGGPYLTGWRPAYTGWENEREAAWVERGRRMITVPPLWNSGIRHFPKVLTEVIEQLGGGIDETKTLVG